MAKNTVDVLVEKRDALLAQMRGDATKKELADIEAQIERAENDARAAAAAKRQAQVEALHKRDVQVAKELRALIEGPLSAKLAEVQTVHSELAHFGEHSNAAIPGEVWMTYRAVSTWKTLDALRAA